MIMFEDFRDKTTGNVDWKAYRKAQMAVGECCCECEACIVWHSFGAPPGPQRCAACQALDNPKEEVTHRRFLRCPHCGRLQDIREIEEEYIYEEGVESITCSHCEKEYVFTVHVSFTYTSPSRVTPF